MVADVATKAAHGGRKVASSRPTTNAEKAKARQLTYRRLLEHAQPSGIDGITVIHYDEPDELRRRLGLENTITSIGLFKSCIWHLNTGDRESNGRPLISWRRPVMDDDWRREDMRRFVIIML